jgi:hypothetical protein
MNEVEAIRDAIDRGEVYVHVRGTLRAGEDIAPVELATIDGSGDLILCVRGAADK